MAFSRLPAADFRVLSSEALAPELIARLLSGTAPACHFRGVVPADVCRAVAANFDAATTADRTDGVSGRHVGAYHYRKSITGYLDDVDRAADWVRSLFAGTTDPLAAVHAAVGEAARSLGLGYRAAAHDGRSAGGCVARCWTANGNFALAPHEDAAQLEWEEQRGFEIQRVAAATVVGVNVCVRKSGRGGSTLVWNLRPDADTRAELGLTGTGYPYPPAFFAADTPLELPVAEGDVYLLNSSLLHAVYAQPDGDRVTLAYLCGRAGDSTVLYWT